MNTISVLLVDDHTVVRSGLKALLSTQGDIAVVGGEAASGEEALEAAHEHTPAVVLMDLAMGAGMDGIEAIKLLRQWNPKQAVIVFTTYDSDATSSAQLMPEQWAICSRTPHRRRSSLPCEALCRGRA